MYRVAIIEDEKSCQEQVREYIARYGEEHAISFDISDYADGAEIAEDVDAHYDILFFDIEMEQMNGMEAAKIVRSRDQDAVIVFITNMAQYAIDGYEVGALDFVLKPIDYYSFSFRMERAISRVKARRENLSFFVNTTGGMKKLNSNDVYYVEIENRILHYHTGEGDFAQRGTLQSAEEMLRDYHFVKCNHWYLVNLKYVTQIQDNVVTVAGSELEISRRNRAHFLKEVTDYIGGGL